MLKDKYCMLIYKRFIHSEALGVFFRPRIIFFQADSYAFIIHECRFFIFFKSPPTHCVLIQFFYPYLQTVILKTTEHLSV